MEAESDKAEPATPRHRGPASITTTTHIGAFGCLGKLVGLLLLIALSWFAVEIGVQLWADNQVALIEHLAEAGLDQDAKLPTLLAQGNPDAAQQIVLACDLAAPDCQRVLGWLLQYREANPVQVVADSDESPRLVLLQRPTDESRRRVAEWLQALDQEGKFWAIMHEVVQAPRPLGVGQVETLASDAGVHQGSWNRMRAEPEVALRVRTDTTMAEALEIPKGVGVLASGIPIRPEALATEAALSAALQAEAEGLARLVKAARGDVPQAQRATLVGLPEAVRQRYVAWILLGERAGAPMPR